MLISKNKFFKGLALVLAVMMILPAVLACTDEAAQQSISEIKDSMLSEQDVKDIVAAAIAANPGVTADDIANIVKDATKDLASAADVDAAVKEAVKDLPTQEKVDAAIKEAVDKIETENKAEADADAALIAKATQVKAQIEVLKETYASKKEEFSAADYAAIVTLISTASSNVTVAKTVEEIEAIYTKLEADLATYASYALALYTKWLALNGNIVAGKTDADEDSLAAVTEYQNLVKEAVAHYYKNGKATTDLTKYVYAYNTNYNTPLTIDLLAAAGKPTIVAGVVTEFSKTNTDVIYSVGSTTYTSLANQYYVAFKTAAENAAKDVDNLIKAIKTVSLADDSQAKITAARNAYTALYNRFIVNGKLVAELPMDETTKGLKVVKEYATLTAAEAETIHLRSAAAALMYKVVDGKPLTDAYQEIHAKNYLDNWKGTFSDEDYAYAKAVMDAVKAWAVEADLWIQPALKSSQDFSAINYFFADFEKTYWGVDNIRLTNAAYNKIIANVKSIAEINKKIGDKVSLIDADARKEIDDLAKSIVNNQKVKYRAYNSGKKYYEEKSATSMQVSNTVKMLKAATAQIAETTEGFLDQIDSQYIGASTTINGIAYAGYKTSGNDAGRFLVGFNATITEFMYNNYSVASAKIDEFKKAVEALNVTAAVSTEAAINMLVDIEGWKAETKESTGFDYSADVADSITALNTKIAEIKTKVDDLKDDYDDLKKAIELINKDDDAVKNYTGSKQSSTQRGRIDTLDKPQIDAAWDLYLKFIANGGSNLLAYQKSNASKVNGVQTYNYEVYVDNAKLEALANAKIALDKCTAAADKFAKAIDELTKKLHKDLGALDYTDYDVAKDADKYFLGHNETVKVNGENTIVWVREMTIVEALEAIKAAYAVFKTTNNNEKFKPVEDMLATEAYIYNAFAYVKAMAIDTIEAQDAAAGLILASIEVIEAATTQAELDVALTHFNTVTGKTVAYSVTMADFGLSNTTVGEALPLV